LATLVDFMRIITFGDSLTSGYQSPSEKNPTGEATPYGRFLKARLGESAEVKIRGINGELTKDMVLRFDRDVLNRFPDYVVILGGANDLGWGIPPAEVINNLTAMYERATRSRIKAVAITIPSIRGVDALIPPRQSVNRAILDYCRENSHPVIDFFLATAEPDTLRLAETYSNDGLHLTTEGYRFLAELLYEKIFMK
jgi:acyl-CoA thioesterase I